MPRSLPARVDVAVIGAGQAGLPAAHHLLRRGLRDWSTPGEAPSFAILDGERGPGGAWRHRWDSLTMRTVNGIHELPGMAPLDPDPAERSSAFLTRRFGEYEAAEGILPVRPARVTAVREADPAAPGGLLRAEVSGPAGPWSLLTGAVVNATGTWSKPFWPFVPGAASFLGEQLHTAEYVSAEAFRGRRVAVVGGGISAVQFLGELSRVAETHWFTRREPEWREAPFDEPARIAAVARVEDRVRRGLPPESVVAVTGLIWTPELRAAAARGALERRPMFRAIEPGGLRLADGGVQPVDVILWATGFRAALDHLAPLGLRAPGGGIAVAGTEVVADPRVHLIGYGPSSSTIGANRAGRAAVAALLRRREAARSAARVSAATEAPVSGL